MHSATLDIITGRWHMIMAGHEAAIRRPLIWTMRMQSLELLQWISVWRTAIWLVDLYLGVFFVKVFPYRCLSFVLTLPMLLVSMSFLIILPSLFPKCCRTLPWQYFSQ